jgi:hypothetical protein
VGTGAADVVVETKVDVVMSVSVKTMVEVVVREVKEVSGMSVSVDAVTDVVVREVKDVVCDFLVSICKPDICRVTYSSC